MRALTAFLLLAGTSFIAFGDTKVIEKRGAVTCRATDWSHDPRNTVDVPAEPVGGMRAFVSRLDYPQSLRQHNVTGVARVKLSLDAAGHIRSAEIIQSVNPILDAIVLKAVQSTRWQPAIRKGKPVAWKFSFPVTFTR